MRLATVIIALTAIAVTLIHLRRAEMAARCDIQRLQLQQVSLNRTMWDQQIILSHIKSPQEVRRRSQEMALDLVTPDASQKRLSSTIGPDRLGR